MNLERFHDLLQRRKTEYEKLRIVKILSNLMNHLQAQINEPSNPEHQKSVSTQRVAIREALLKSSTNSAPLSDIQDLEELHLPLFLAPNLLKAIEAAFHGNDVTPQIAAEALKSTIDELTQNLASVTGVLEGLQYFHVQGSALSPGESEISALIPRSYVEESPQRLGTEIIEFQDILNPFAEMATGAPQIFRIKTLSSSDYLIILAVAANLYLASRVTTAFAEAIRQLLGIYKDVVEIRIMTSKLK